MRKIAFPPLLFLIFFTFSCGQSSDNTSPKSSFGQALESSLSQSPSEKKARSLAQQRQEKLQASQQKLQQDRLKSYSNTNGYDRNP